MTKHQIKKLLRDAECQCLLWEIAVARGEKSAQAELAKWEAEYNALETLL